MTDVDARYRLGEAHHRRAEQLIPLGAQTFSKSRKQYLTDEFPLYVKRAKGSRAWDLDGNEYIDFVSSLCAVILGHNDPDVTAAVQAQLEDGVLFSTSHPLELAVAEKLHEMIPCAEMVRFGKNGSDATAGAIRLARAYTGNTDVAVCGYHGWQDWYIGSTPRGRGVPESVKAMTHTFEYNDLESLYRIAKRVDLAAVILEPMKLHQPNPGFLEGLKEFAADKGAVLIFDEMITGFRMANGGAQELFGVTPDLACFGKAIANGYPLSALVGKAEIMRLLADDVFFSFTNGGECLSLAAALATLTKLQREPVVEHITRLGQRLFDEVNERRVRHGVGAILHLHGPACRSVLQATETVGLPTPQRVYIKEVAKRGILTYGAHNMTYAHTDADVDRLLEVYDEVFPLVLTKLKRTQTTTFGQKSAA